MEFAVVLFFEQEKFSVVSREFVEQLPGGTLAINQDFHAKEGETSASDTANFDCIT